MTVLYGFLWGVCAALTAYRSYFVALDYLKVASVPYVSDYVSAGLWAVFTGVLWQGTLCYYGMGALSKRLSDIQDARKR